MGCAGAWGGLGAVCVRYYKINKRDVFVCFTNFECEFSVEMLQRPKNYIIYYCYYIWGGHWKRGGGGQLLSSLLPY